MIPPGRPLRADASLWVRLLILNHPTCGSCWPGRWHRNRRLPEWLPVGGYLRSEVESRLEAGGADSGAQGMSREQRMACRGVFFALTDDEAARLLAAPSDETLVEIIQEEIEERWDEEWLQETDKAWDAMHRCLTDGSLSIASISPLHRCVLGGRQLYDGDDYIVSFLTPPEVEEVAAALRPIDRAWMRERYARIDPTDYDEPLSEEDFEYTWEWFQGVQAFYRKAATGRRAVIFSVDQ